MTVYFESDRQAWRYDFVCRGKRYSKQCPDAKSKAQALEIESGVRQEALKAAKKDIGAVGWIYFVAVAEGRYFKVGWAHSIQRRLRALQTAQPESLLVLARVRGSKRDEQRFHETLANFRANGEWFELNAVTRAFIATIEAPEKAIRALRDKLLVPEIEVPPKVGMVGLADQPSTELSP